MTPPRPTDPQLHLLAALALSPQPLPAAAVQVMRAAIAVQPHSREGHAARRLRKALVRRAELSAAEAVTLAGGSRAPVDLRATLLARADMTGDTLHRRLARETSRNVLWTAAADPRIGDEALRAVVEHREADLWVWLAALGNHTVTAETAAVCAQHLQRSRHAHRHRETEKALAGMGPTAQRALAEHCSVSWVALPLLERLSGLTPAGRAAVTGVLARHYRSNLTGLRRTVTAARRYPECVDALRTALAGHDVDFGGITLEDLIRGTQRSPLDTPWATLSTSSSTVSATVAAALTDAAGDDVTAWQALVQLGQGFDGTVAELVGAVQALRGAPAVTAPAS